MSDERRKGRAEEVNRLQELRRVNADLRKKERSLEIMRREVSALTARWGAESEFYRDQIKAKEIDIANFKVEVVRLRKVDLEQCAACGEYFTKKGGVYAKHIKKCTKLPEV